MYDSFQSHVIDLTEHQAQIGLSVNDEGVAGETGNNDKSIRSNVNPESLG